MAALVPAMTLEYYELGWWLGHGWELIGIAFVGAPAALDLYRGAPSRPLAGDLRAAELVQAADAFMGPTVRALLLRLAEKDAYTEGHTRRVALLAVQMGEELGMAPIRLRHLAMGGLVHDIGKLSVSDEILQKPGPLDDEEFEVIRHHPEWGHDLVQELGVFPGAVARLVLDHHERLDGRGYPRGLDRGQARPRDADHGRLRRLRRPALHARLPRGMEPGARAGAAPQRVRLVVRPRVRRGARAGRAAARSSRLRRPPSPDPDASGTRRTFGE